MGGARVDLAALEVRIRLEVAGRDAEDVAADLRERWALCEVPDDAEPETTIPVTLDDEAVDPVDGAVHATERDSLLQLTTQAVTHAAIAGSVGRRLMLHAAGIAHPESGATLVCVAAGGTGKTTLCRTLGPRWSYVTDETVAIDDDGTILPYPKPLSVRVPDRSAKEETDPRALGLRPPAVRPWIAGLVVLERSDDHHGPARLEPFDLLDAIVALAPQSSSLSRLDRPLHRLADLIERLPTTGTAHYRDADTLADLVERAIA